MLSIFLTVAAIILLLVLVVPIGIALYQRLKPAPPAKPAAPPRAAPPPPRVAEQKPAVPDMKPAVQDSKPAAFEPKTERVPVLRPDSPPAAEPKPPANLEETRTAKPKEPPKQGEGAGTEMMEWYGMLRCTAGPLQGQTFIVEDEGLFIGRDPSVAQIVVNDSRVSKRHVRILPRNGKVWAIDEGSTNGTFLGSAGGERITEHPLKRGDTLVLAEGAATFVYQI